MSCFKCGKEGGTSLTLCPTCASEKKESYAKGLAQKAAIVDVLAKESGMREKQLLIAAAALLVMILFLSLMLYNVGAFGFGKLPPAILGESTTNKVSKLDPCDSKERCVVVYLSPSSENSQKLVPIMNILIQNTLNHKRVGSQIIIGGDTGQRLAEFSQSFKGETYQDYLNLFAQKVTVTTSPSWWVIDRNRNIVMKGKSLPLPSISEQSTYNEMINAYLKLSDYFE